MAERPILSVRISEEVDRLIDIEVKKSKSSRGAVVERALRNYLAKKCECCGQVI